MTDTPVPDVRELARRAAHDQSCALQPFGHAAGVFCSSRASDAVADAVLAAVEPVIRRQVADRIEEEIRRQVVAGAAMPLQPGGVPTAVGIVNWLVEIIRAASHSTQPTEEETTNG